MSVDVTQMMVQFVSNIFGDREAAMRYASDPAGEMVAAGLTEQDMSGVDMRQVVGQACDSAGVPSEARGALQSYTGGGSGPASHPGTQTATEVLSHVTYATQVVYQNDQTIQQTIVDQSQHVNISGSTSGPITIDNDPQNVIAHEGGTAVGEQGDGNAAVASGAGSQAIGGDNSGQANTGAGAVQVETGAGGAGGAGPGGSGGAGGSVGPIVTGGAQGGIVAGGAVTDAVVGHGNQTAQVDGPTQGTVFNFGAGDVAQSGTGPAAAGGGDAITAHIDASQGAGVAIGGSASGQYRDDDTTTTTTETHTSTIQAQDSVVGVEQGQGDQSQHATQTQDELEPKEA